jgi:hypothetical protein
MRTALYLLRVAAFLALCVAICFGIRDGIHIGPWGWAVLLILFLVITEDTESQQLPRLKSCSLQVRRDWNPTHCPRSAH